MFRDDTSPQMSVVVDAGRRAGSPDRADLPVVAVYRDQFPAPADASAGDQPLILRGYRPVVVTRAAGDHGGDVAVIEARARTRLRRAWSGMRARRGRYPLVTAALRDAGARVVHAHTGQGGTVVRRCAAALGLPLVVTFHGPDVTIAPAALAKGSRVDARYVRERAQLFRACTTILTVSQYLAGRLVEQGAPPDRVRVIPPGIDTRQFSAGPVPEHGPIVFVGRLVETNGCADLLRAVAALDNAPPAVVIGDGPLRDELERLAADLRVRVAFKGTQSGAAVRDALRRARVVVVPPRTAANGEQQGLPVVALEAAAAGRPVVASRHSGLGECVIDGRTGVLYREGDTTALRDALDAVLRDPARAQAYGTAGRAWVRERFDLGGVTRQIEDVYDMVSRAAGDHP